MRREPSRTGFAASWCECGRPKYRGAEGCPRCLELDGNDIAGADGRLLAVLRRSGPLETGDLAAELGVAHRNVQRIAGPLLAAGALFASDAERQGGGTPRRVWSLWPACPSCRSAKVRGIKSGGRSASYCISCDFEFPAGGSL